MCFVGIMTFRQWQGHTLRPGQSQGSLPKKSSDLEQRIAQWSKDLFETRDALYASVKEGISDMNRHKAYQLEGKVDLFGAELKELKIRYNLL